MLVIVASLSCGGRQQETTEATVPGADGATRVERQSSARTLDDSARPRIEVVVDDTEVSIARVLPVGPVRFEVRNVGTEDHGFLLSSDELEVRTEDQIAPGQVVEIDAELEPGSYRAICPLRGHPPGVPKRIVATERARF
jgi:hypothetical protein